MSVMQSFAAFSVVKVYIIFLFVLGIGVAVLVYRYMFCSALDELCCTYWHRAARIPAGCSRTPRRDVRP